MALLPARLNVGRLHASRLNYIGAGVPTAPGTITATPELADVVVRWSAAASYYGVAGYQVWHCAGAGCTTFAHIASVVGLEYRHTGLAPSSTHRYHVRAYDAAETLGPFSAIATATTAPPPPPTQVWLQVGGVWHEVSGFARVSGATITQALNEVLDTASLRFSGDIPFPLQGTKLVISDVRGVWQFAGHITAVRTVYEGRAANVAFDVDAVDFTWLLAARKVTARYVGWTVADIFYLLITNFAPAGFTLDTGDLTQNPALEEITFTNEDLPQAFSRTCERAGAYWYVDTNKAIRLFNSAAAQSAGTIDQTACQTASRLASHADGAAVVTRVHARGGGSTASCDLPVGAATLPVDDAVWYATTGGLVECGPQRLAYTGVSNPGTGALVGSGNAPSATPSVAAASGTNLAQGAVYKYAVSFVTANGETLPGPIHSYTPLGASIPPAPAPVYGPDIRDTGQLAGGQNQMVPGGSYRWAWGKFIAGGGRVPGSPGAPIIVTDKYWQIRIPSELFDDPNVAGVDPYRTTNGGSTFHADGQTYMRGAIGWVTTGWAPDGDLAQFGQMGGGGGTLLAAQLSQIPVYGRPNVVSARKLYRTPANGTTLQLLATLADNTTTTYLDTTPDAGLGQAAPTIDSSGIQGGGQINAGVPSILVSNIAPFSPAGGWVRVGNLILRFTGTSASSIVLAAPLPNTLSYGSEITNAPHLVGLPASGAGAIVYPIKGGDEVLVYVIRDDPDAIAALAAATGGDGVRIEFLTDGRLALAELTARAAALLAMRAAPLETVTFETRDPNVSVGKTITFATTSPPITGTFLIQRVQISEFPAAGARAVAPRRVVEASSRRYTFEDLVHQVKLLGRIN